MDNEWDVEDFDFDEDLGIDTPENVAQLVKELFDNDPQMLQELMADFEYDLKIEPVNGSSEQLDSPFC